MRLGFDRYYGCVSSFGFLLLFPGFYIYHSFLAWGFIDPVLAGLFGPVSALVTLLFLVTLSRLLSVCVGRVGLYFVLFLLFSCFVFAWTFVWYVLGDGEHLKFAVKQSLETLVLWLALFFIGAFVSLDSKLHKVALNVFFSFVFVFLFYYVLSTGKVMYYARAESGMNPDVATYQGFALSVLIVLFFLLATVDSVKQRAWIAIGGTFALFILGARSELYAYALVVSILFLNWTLSSLRYQLFVGFVVIAVTILLYFSIDFISSSRQFQVFDLSKASSWVARQEFMQLALSQIAASPILGDFGAHIRDGGGLGAYSHNILSAWVNYGVFGFFVYFMLTSIALAYSGYFLICKRVNGSILILSFSVNLASMVLVLIAKPVFWPIPALGWGLFAQVLMRRKRNNEVHLRHV